MEHICIVFATDSGTSISLCHWNGRIWSDLNRLLVKFFVNLYGKLGKEIAMEKHRDGEQEMGVMANKSDEVRRRCVSMLFLLSIRYMAVRLRLSFFASQLILRSCLMISSLMHSPMFIIVLLVAPEAPDAGIPVIKSINASK